MLEERVYRVGGDAVCGGLWGVEEAGQETSQ